MYDTEKLTTIGSPYFALDILIMTVLVYLCTAPRMGRKPVVPAKVEEEVVWYCLHRYKYGYGVRWASLPRLVTNIIQIIIRHFPSLQGRLSGLKATHQWLNHFRGRHKDVITKRKAEFLDMARAANANEGMLKLEVATRMLFLEELDKLNGGPGEASNVLPSDLWNCDETPFTNAGEGGDVIAPTGQGDCRQLGDEHGEHISALLLCCADGHLAEPFYVMKGTRIPTDKSGKLTEKGRLIGVGDGCAFAMAPKGNMNTQVGHRPSLTGKGTAI